MKFETLRFEGMGYCYEDSSRPVFNDVTFDLPTEKNVWVTGAQGNGQSTLLKLTAVLLQPQQGRFLINGQDTSQMSFEEFLPMRLRIGYSFDFGGLFANRTLLDNLTLPLLYHKIMSPEQAETEVRALIERFRFSSQMHLRPASVSGGLRKLACVLRSFILRPEMLVLDDPFTGLDPQTARSVIQLVGERREMGELKHVFFTSRDETWPDRLGYEPLIIENGVLRLEKRADPISGNGKVA